VESTHTIDIDKFVPEADIDKRYYERPYYVVPDGKSGEDAYAVIRNREHIVPSSLEATACWLRRCGMA
jgi:non-homologous end joining protein Ku